MEKLFDCEDVFDSEDVFNSEDDEVIFDEFDLKASTFFSD